MRSIQRNRWVKQGWLCIILIAFAIGGFPMPKAQAALEGVETVQSETYESASNSELTNTMDASDPSGPSMNPALESAFSLQDSLAIATTSSTEYMQSPNTSIYPAFVDNHPYEAWTIEGKTGFFQLETNGSGVAPLQWSLVSGSLPDGLSLSPDGKISGTPTTEGTYSFRVRVTDASSAAAEKDLTMEANPYRAKWMTDAKFGIMAQWGPFTEPALMTKADIASFEARADHFNAEAWCQGVKDLGGKVLNFTVKGGDGIRLWPSTTPSKYELFTQRDFTGELIEACHDRGIKFVAYVAPDHTWNKQVNEVSALDETWGTLNIGLIEELIDKGVDGFWIDMSATPEIFDFVDPGWFDWSRIIPLMRSKNPYVTFASNAGVENGGTILKWPDTDIINYEGVTKKTSASSLAVAVPNPSGKKLAIEVDNMLDKEWTWVPSSSPPEPKAAQGVIDSIQANWNIGATYMLNYPIETNGNFIPAPYQSTLAEIGSWVKANQGWSATPQASTDDSQPFSAPIDVALTAGAGAEIRYTTDGSMPTKQSVLYAGPIHLTDSTYLRAIAYESGKGSSVVMDKYYVIVPAVDHSRALAIGGNLAGSAGNGITEQTDVYRGMKIVVGEQPMTVDRIGRYFIPGNTGTHTLMIKRFKDDAVLVQTKIDMAAGSPDNDGFKYKRIVPIVLEPHKTYYVLSSENSSDAHWQGDLDAVKTDISAHIAGKHSIPITGSKIPAINDGEGQLLNLKYTSNRVAPNRNLALGKAAYLQDNSGQPLIPSNYIHYAEDAVDGDPATRAQAAWSWPWTLHVDLGKVEKGINEVVANFAIDNGTSFYATSYEIWLSVDGTNWVKVSENPKNAAMRNGAKFAPTDARYVRFRALTPDGPDQPGFQMSISELEVYKNDLAYGSQAVMLDSNGNTLEPAGDDTLPLFAVDGDSGTATAPNAAAGDGDWTLQSDLGVVKNGINNVLVSFPQGKTPTDWQIQLSADGNSWTAVDTLASYNGRTRYSSVFTPVDARYVRIVSTNKNASWAVSALEVYNDNLALGTSAKMYGNSENELGVPGPAFNAFASNAVDGNPDTYAQAAGEYDWIFHNDLGRVEPGVQGILVMFDPNNYATEYRISTSVDGVNWTVKEQVTGNHSGGIAHTSHFSPTDVRYIRVKAIKPNAPNQEGHEMGISMFGVYTRQWDDAQIDSIAGDYVSEYDQVPIVIRNREDTEPTITAVVYSDSATAGMNIQLTRQPDGSYRTMLGFSKIASGNGKVLVKDGDHVWVSYLDVSNRVGDPQLFLSDEGTWRDSSAYNATVEYRIGGDENAVALQPGKLLDAAVTVTNRMADSKPVIVITALYNRDGAMVNVSYLSKTIQSLQTENFHTGFLLPAEVTDYTVKTFVWDGTDLSNTQGIPYTEPVQFP